MQITYVAGYGNSFNDVPEEIRVALSELVASKYENREPLSAQAFKENPLGGLMTLANYRMNWF